MKLLSDCTRLFDCIDYLLENSPQEDMFALKENGNWIKFSTRQSSDYINHLSAGLLSLGITAGDMTEEARDKIAVIAKNRPEWLMLDLAVQRIGAVLTPIYPTISVNELEFILNDAEVKLVFVNDALLYNKIDSLRNKLPFLKDIYSFAEEDGIKNWKQIFSLSTPEKIATVIGIANKIKSEDIATIIYTSGTTGVPKGVMLSHKNILSNVMSAVPCFPPGKLRALSFLPLNHIFERMVSYLYMYKGTSIYFAESLETIGDNLKEISPDIFTTVPRMLEKVYDKIMAKGRELTGIKRKLFFWAHDLAAKFELNTNLGLMYNLQLSVANKLIFKKWREALGNRIVCIISGGAACQVRLIRIFTAAKIPIMEGYGLTETSPVISTNRFNEKQRMIGTVGPLLNGVEVMIAADNEILCKGPNVMMGYYKQPQLTDEAFENGWFKTGDIGIIVDNTFLKITDRKKEMFKTSGGKYVAPLPIENKLKESMYVENVMVIGAERKFTAALIIPSFPNLREWCNKNGVAYTTDEEMINDHFVKEMYHSLVESFNKYFNPVEQVKKFALLPKDWSVEGGELTPKLSLRRKVIMEKYNDAVEKIYHQLA